jgi:ribosome-associated protein
MTATSLNALLINALENVKGQKIVTLNVKDLTDVTDSLIIATGTSSRHVKSLANNLVEEAKSQGYRPLGMEGMTDGEWVLVDFGDTVVHVMSASAREFYDLEKLWSKVPANRSGDSGS